MQINAVYPLDLAISTVYIEANTNISCSEKRTETHRAPDGLHLMTRLVCQRANNNIMINNNITMLYKTSISKYYIKQKHVLYSKQYNISYYPIDILLNA